MNDISAAGFLAGFFIVVAGISWWYRCEDNIKLTKDIDAALRDPNKRLDNMMLKGYFLTSGRKHVLDTQRNVKNIRYAQRLALMGLGVIIFSLVFDLF
jgi:hypothetical protein